MKLLLDTHIFIWWAHEPEKLSTTVLTALEEETNDLLVSVVSIWEMQVKSQAGKMKLRLPLKELVEGQQTTNDIKVLPVELAHVLALDVLPFHHKDPFDRLLLAQAIAEGMTVVSADRVFPCYPIQLIQ